MFHYGITQWISGNEDLERAFRRLSEFGYHSMEFSSEPYTMDREKCKCLMDKYGIACASLCGAFGPGRDLTAENADSAVQYLKDSVDLAVELGASVLITVPSPPGRAVPPAGFSYDRLWGNAVKNIRAAADYAGDRGVFLAIEPLNRYESYLVNTVFQALCMAEEIAHPAVGIMADTFHMNIEESNIASAIIQAGGHLKHVHVADSNRGPAGAGHIDFSAVLHALKDIHYSGEIVMEYVCRAGDSETLDRYAKASVETLRAFEYALTLNKNREA